MARFTDAEWIMLSEIFRGEEERCHKLLKAYPEEDLFEQDWHRFLEEGIITDREAKLSLSRLDALLEVIYGGGLPEMIAFMEQKV